MVGDRGEVAFHATGIFSWGEGVQLLSGVRGAAQQGLGLRREIWAGASWEVVMTRASPRKV